MDAPIDIASLLPSLETDQWFSSCPEELRQALLSNAKIYRCLAGEALYRRGDSARHALFCVAEGAIRLSSSLQDGAPFLLVYLEPCHWFGDMSLIDGKPYIHDAIADVDTQVLCISLQALTQWLDQNPVYWRDIARLSMNKLRVAYQVIGEPGALHYRLARRLWLMAHGFGSRTHIPSIQLTVSQEHLAQMMGSTRQSINAALARLEQLGLLTHGYKSIELHNLENLIQHANHLGMSASTDSSDSQ
ncbi:Transcriptional regulator, Crp/Fnr family [Pseudomonas cichorii]|uniref:Transcriptional regulator, Crp/Fnr family n=1 Tax=Pseudomonas cichorii TaxID=36746 RepID=A0A3M4LWF9_PSECI|nr:Crp/Fnr family transcriptional regulator [Pseudomonas cichorii]RMQ45833.1 Transcriptional regulator, Crp/Fnr family [Pseudomonas cichorii]